MCNRCINIWQQNKFYTLNSLVFKEPIQESTQLWIANQIYKSLENNQYTLGVSIDLSKAFDTVNHSVLIKKFQMYGIRGVNLAWFCSYFANRKQYISLGSDL